MRIVVPQAVRAAECGCYMPTSREGGLPVERARHRVRYDWLHALPSLGPPAVSAIPASHAVRCGGLSRAVSPCSRRWLRKLLTLLAGLRDLAIETGGPVASLGP